MNESTGAGHEDHSFRAPAGMAWGLGTIAFVFVVMSAVLWVAWFRAVQVTDPLTIVACTPESYVAPAEGERGPAQNECDAPKAPPNDSVTVGEAGITVSGQVCNDAGSSVAYQVTVRWLSIDGDSEYGSGVDVPITYPSGCSDPYTFTFETPEALPLIETADASGSFGLWRVVGTAAPVNAGRYDLYQWDVTKTFELVEAPDKVFGDGAPSD